METIVAKFGGTSLADTARVQTVLSIIKENSLCRYVIVSAPGRRFPTDTKVTDLLVQANIPGRRPELFARVRERFRELHAGLALPESVFKNITDELDYWSEERHLPGGIQEFEHETLALGERLCARLVAGALGWPWVCAKEVIRFDHASQYSDQLTMTACQSLPPHAIIPGFYGACPDGRIALFPRNGSDISGAAIAAGVDATVYENWTDTDGILAADPRVVRTPRSITMLTREELQELAYRGASVLHGDALYPLSGTSIPVRVRNTSNPSHPGTYVVKDRSMLRTGFRSVVGIAGRTGFSIVSLHKLGMNQNRGFLANLCGEFDALHISIELAPGGINSQSIVVDDSELAGKEERLRVAIELACRPDRLSIEHGTLALLCVVGETMAHQHGVAARALGAIAQANVNVRVIDQGASEISIILGVHADDYEKAYRALYQEFNP